MQPDTIDVLVEREGEWWVAQCLQVNVATQARTLPELRAELDRILAAHFETCTTLKIDPFASPAPARIWSKYAATQEAIVDQRKPNPERPYIPVPNVVTRISA
jgi:hypothetical protein